MSIIVLLVKLLFPSYESFWHFNRFRRAAAFPFWKLQSLPWACAVWQMKRSFYLRISCLRFSTGNHRAPRAPVLGLGFWSWVWTGRDCNAWNPEHLLSGKVVGGVEGTINPGLSIVKQTFLSSPHPNIPDHSSASSSQKTGGPLSTLR